MTMVNLEKNSGSLSRSLSGLCSSNGKYKRDLYHYQSDDTDQDIYIFTQYVLYSKTTFFIFDLSYSLIESSVGPLPFQSCTAFFTNLKCLHDRNIGTVVIIQKIGVFSISQRYYYRKKTSDTMSKLNTNLLDKVSRDITVKFLQQLSGSLCSVLQHKN